MGSFDGVIGTWPATVEHKDRRQSLPPTGLLTLGPKKKGL